MGDNGLIFSSAKEGKWVLIIMIMDGPKTLVIGLRIGIGMAHGAFLESLPPLLFWQLGSFKRNLANAENFKGII